MAKEQQFKFIKGTYCQGEPADICFYTDVDYWSVNDFLWEFDYLTNYVNPSKIRVHINSAGGDVVEGMSVFAKIIDSKIPTECINDALAASMGSIIWAAGDSLYMKDYALLMIHNPFCDCGGEKKYNQATEAFTEQLKTIYSKRFGFSEQEVQDIMDGKEGNDGTFLTAAQAVERGFISQDRVIETPRAIKDKICAALTDARDIAQIKAVFGLAASSIQAETIKKQNNKPNEKTMEENKLPVFAAMFGLTGDKATVENVTAKINEIKATAAKAEEFKKNYDAVKAELTEVKAELTGAQTSVKNLTNDLESVKAELKGYKDAEAQAKAAKVDALINQAVKDCKINKEEVEAYTKMATDNYDLAVNVLAKIPARANLGQEISTANQQSAKNGMTSEEEKIAAKVEELVGKDFKFRTLD